MEWTPDLSVGVEAIDNQHKELIRRMNGFFDSMQGDNQKKVLDMLGFLGDYVVTHFRDEEALQVRYNYPNYTAHKKLHEAFEKDVREMAEDIDKNGLTFASKALVGSKLTNWLSQHIRKCDKAVGDFIRG